MGGQLQLWLGAAMVIGPAAFLFWRVVSARETLAEQAATKPDIMDLLNQTEDVSDRETLIEKVRGAINETTSKTIDDRESGKRLLKLLERGGSKLRPGEWLIATIGVAFFVALLCVAIRGTITGLLGFFLVGFISYYRLVKAVAKRRDAFDNQLSDVLQMLSVSLRSGLSLVQAVQLVSQEAPSPTGEEFRRVIAEQRVGRDLTDSFRALAARMDSKDFEWVVSAIDINRSVGGDLAQILGRVERTIRARNKVRGQVAALSAEGRMSGLVLVSLPPGMLFLINLVNPEFVEPLFNETIGWVLLGVAGAMLSMGWFWLSRLSSFEY